MDIHEMPIQLTQRTSHLVGRLKEVQLITESLHSDKPQQVLYFEGGGGLGKTRLMEEVAALTAQSGSGYICSGIIDLYHTHTHSASQVERILIQVLDPDNRYFNNYRKLREAYEQLREEGGSPTALERRRKELRNTFVEEICSLLGRVKKLVVIFDTVELLQYESSTVESVIGLKLADTQIRDWMLDVLPKLDPILLVLAGRPRSAEIMQRLDADLRSSFGDGYTHVSLKPLDRSETRLLIDQIESDLLPYLSANLDALHDVTGGRPILLHLVIDLLAHLSEQPRRILEILSEQSRAQESGMQTTQDARSVLERIIIESLVNDTGKLGAYLLGIAHLAKGFDVQILQEGLEISLPEAEYLMKILEPLSFIKRYRPLPGVDQPGEERLFLHDEMYDLLSGYSQAEAGRRQDYHRVREKRISLNLDRYYQRLISQQEAKLEELHAYERTAERERLHRMVVERLFYQLVYDPLEGYKKYRNASYEANQRRWVSFNMMLRDEFMRFLERYRILLEEQGVTGRQVIRESAVMWIERLHWWSRYNEELEAAERILDNPLLVQIDPQNDAYALGDICALWARAHTMKHGYDAWVVLKTQQVLAALPPVPDCSPPELLARGRLGTSIGYSYRWAGQLEKAEVHNNDAIAAFRMLDEFTSTYLDEKVIVLNNQAYVYARLGQLRRAHAVGREAMRINRGRKSYSAGLTYTNLAAVERIAGDNAKAIEYGVLARRIFEIMQDTHGTIRAYFNIANAMRWQEKGKLRKAEYEDVWEQLNIALDLLGAALAIASENHESEIPGLLLEQAKVYREIVRNWEVIGAPACTKEDYYLASLSCMNAARLELDALPSLADKADLLQDEAELHWDYGETALAHERLAEMEKLIPHIYRLIPGEAAFGDQEYSELFLPLGKAEQLRGEISYAHGAPDLALQHFSASFAYYTRFSPQAYEVDRLADLVFDMLVKLPVGEQEALIQNLKTWGDQFGYAIGEVPISQFIDDLEHLLGY